jgi:uncharacterized membrane protein YccC
VVVIVAGIVCVIVVVCGEKTQRSTELCLLVVVWLGFTYLLLSHSPINVATVTIAIVIPNTIVSSLNNDLSIVVVVVVGI